MKNVHKHLFSALTVAFAFVLLLGSGSSKSIPKLSFLFDHAPKGTVAPGSADISVILIKPAYADEMRSVEDISLFSRYREGLSGDMAELLIAKGFSLKGPYDQKADMTFTDKKNSPLLLEIKISPRIDGLNALRAYASTKSGAYYKGTLSFGGRIELSVREPMSDEKIWTKSAELPIQNNVEVKTDKYHSELTLKSLLEDGSFYNPIGEAMQKSYETVLNKMETYIERDEFKALLPQVKELKSRKQ
jgi:hypothetical protein